MQSDSQLGRRQDPPHTLTPGCASNRLTADSAAVRRQAPGSRCTSSAALRQVAWQRLPEDRVWTHSPPRPEDGAMIWLVLIMGKVIIYVVPSLIAARRQAERLRRIVVVNLLLGWTVIGWIIAMVMATRPHPPPYPPPFEQYGPPPRRPKRRAG